MSENFTLVTELPSLSDIEEGVGRILLSADRVTLAKRRWRARAADGREFGFDLAAPIAHHACFFIDGDKRYIIDQQPESVLEVPIANLEEAACLAWRIGNLHLSAQVMPAAVRVADDPAAVQLLKREGMKFVRHTQVFQPLSAGGVHHHPHAHD